MIKILLLSFSYTLINFLIKGTISSGLSTTCAPAFVRALVFGGGLAFAVFVFFPKEMETLNDNLY